MKSHAYRHLEGVGDRLPGECLGAGDPEAAVRLARAAEILEQCGARNELAKTLVAQAELAAAAGAAARRARWSTARAASSPGFAAA